MAQKIVPLLVVQSEWYSSVSPQIKYAFWEMDTLCIFVHAIILTACQIPLKKLHIWHRILGSGWDLSMFCSEKGTGVMIIARKQLWYNSLYRSRQEN